MSELILEPRHTAVVVIDLQKGIVMMPGTPHPTPTVVANCARLLATARRVGAQPVLVHVGGSPDGADRLRPTADQAMRAATPPSPDWSDFIPELDRQPSDIVILKRQWGAFYGTDLDLQLRRRGLRPSSSAAMTGRNAESHANAVERIFPRMGRVRSTEEIIAALER
jgi:nicotinamidase-related amidase